MPTVAVVQGPAIAGGFGIVLACDLVIASTAARFALPELRRGISPAVVSPLLIYRIGAGPATPILLADQVWTARRPIAWDCVTSWRRRKSSIPLGDELATSILTGAPAALAMTKRLMRSISQATLFEQLEAGRKVSAEARRTAEAREGLTAFLEKREPNWNVRPRSERPVISADAAAAPVGIDGLRRRRIISEGGERLGQFDPRVEPFGHPQRDLTQSFRLVLGDFAQTLGKGNADSSQAGDFTFERGQLVRLGGPPRNARVDPKVHNSSNP